MATNLQVLLEQVVMVVEEMVQKTLLMVNLEQLTQVVVEVVQEVQEL